MQYKTIFETIDEELDLFAELHEVLNEQQQLLLNRDTAGLQEAAGDITFLLDQTRTCRSTRSEELKKLGIKNSPQGMEIFMLSHGSERYQTDWQKLTELVEECKKINQINGETLRMQQEMTEKQLQRLTRTNNSHSYSASGKKVNNRSHNLMATA